MQLRLGSGLVDTAVASIATFAIGLFAALRLSDTPDLLGVYGLAFSAFQLCSQLPGDLVFASTELDLVGRRSGHQLAAAPRTLAQGGAVSAAGGLLAAVAICAVAWSHGYEIVVPLALATALTVTVSPLQDHLRRLFHQAGRSPWAVLVSIAQLVVAAGALTAASIVGMQPTLAPFAALAVANVASLVLGVVLARRGAERGADIEVAGLGATMRKGSWLVVGSMVMRGANFGSMTLIAMYAGWQAVGYLEGARILAQPLVVLALGLLTVARPSIVLALRARRPESALFLHRLFDVTLLAAGAALALSIGWRWPANPLPQLFDAAYVVTGLVAAVALATAYSNGLVVHLSEALAIGRTSTIARIVATGGVAWLITTVIALYAGAGAFSFPLAMSAYALVARLLFRPVLKPVLRPHARTRARRTNEASGSEGAAAADPISLAEQDAAVAALRQRLGPLATMGLRPVPTRILARIATQGDTLAASLARGGLSGRAAIDLDGPAAGMAFVAGARIRPDERRVSALDRALEEYVQPGQVAFDIGAGGGERTLALAGLVGPKGLVVSFEHDQTRADQLTANVGLNHLANVTVLRARTDAAPAPAATGHGVTLHELGQRESTRCVRVDEVVRRSLVPAPQLIVISMPGGETGVLDGLRTVLKRHRPAVLLRIEAGDYASFQRQLADVVDHLVRIGRSVRHLGATTEVGGRFVGVVAGISPPRSARHLEQLDAQALAADVDEVADQTGWRPRAANSGAR